MASLETLKKNKKDIEDKIGYKFKNFDLFSLIFIHRSYFNENKSIVNAHNERIEFLGDSVLGLIVADLLYKLLPDSPEGELSFLLSNLVNATSCAEYMKKLGLDQYILLGKGEKNNTTRGRKTIIADAFEALIGAVYLDGGLQSARELFENNFKASIFEKIEKPSPNFKALLQDYSQKNYQLPPQYNLIEDKGPAHDKVFTVEVVVNNQKIATAEGPTKKIAQQKAAEKALIKLKEIK
ncbi:MAG: ribonuclease III [Chlamydiae bacterium CG10_big_fil_rev_8_21_14_0_10_35_9]|nr:MAG: ribonuclease III [Chlamydiae bacterium CG10_big_fil_rev_8_21_14_0_10_35_9]